MKFFRVQPKGRSLFGHTSKLASDPVRGLFAFEDPAMLFETYTWLHVKKHISSYEMVIFEGRIIERPADSEGVVVQPIQELSRLALRDWLDQAGRRE